MLVRWSREEPLEGTADVYYEFIGRAVNGLYSYRYYQPVLYSTGDRTTDLLARVLK